MTYRLAKHGQSQTKKTAKQRLKSNQETRFHQYFMHKKHHKQLHTLHKTQAKTLIYNQ